MDLDTHTNGGDNVDANTKAKASSTHKDKTKKAQLDENDELSTCMTPWTNWSFFITKTCGTLLARCASIVGCSNNARHRKGG